VKRILFVDDESNILSGIRRMLQAQRNRWEMHFATSGEAALQACAERRFDVVISDMRMPGMDGATLLGRIYDLYPDTARLILTGHSDIPSARLAHAAYRVLAKPCNGIELQSAIERVCSLQDLFCAPELRKVLGTIGELPSLSASYTALTLALRDPATSAATVAGIIESDVAMAAKVLQLVNSGFFGLTQTIASLQNAVNYLGIDTIRNLALASETFRVFKPNAFISQSILEEIQRHAHRTSMIVGALPLDPKIREDSVVAALLHDVGSLVLASEMPHQFHDVLALVKQRGCRQHIAEEELLGTSHAEIGAYLLGLWGIDGRIVDAVAHHHSSMRISHIGLDIAAVVYAADLLAHELDSHPNDVLGADLDPCDRASLEALGLLDQYSLLREQAIQSLIRCVT
jgi:HD-like signal output (HDOD) protein